MQYDFSHPKIGHGGIIYPEKKNINGFTLIEALSNECVINNLQFNRLRMIISNKNGEKLSILKNLGNKLEYTDFVNNKKGYLNTVKDIKIFIMELY